MAQRDLGQRAQQFREKWLVPSGGWLAELTITLSGTTGVWDLLILSAFFIASWIIIRTSPMEIGGILGLLFDLTIPLQYSNDEGLSEEHRYHLDGYWPVQLIAFAVEGLSFFFLHPDLFTLIVPGSRNGRPNRTTRMDLPGSYSEATYSVASSSSCEPDLGSESEASSPGSAQNQTPSHRGQRSQSTNPSYLTQPSSRSSKISSKTPPPDMPACKHDPKAYEHLKKSGYSDPAIAGMINAMNQVGEDKAKKTMRTWTKEKKPEEIARRNKQYEDRARKAGLSAGRPTTTNTSSSSQPPPDTASTSGTKAPPSNMPQSTHFPQAYEYLSKKGYSPPAIAGMINSMNGTDRNQAMSAFKTWCDEKKPEEVTRRNKQYAERAKKAGWSDSGGSSGAGSGSTGVSRGGLTSLKMTKAKVDPNIHRELKKTGYSDYAIIGMITELNKMDEKVAKESLKRWTGEKKPEEIHRRNQVYGGQVEEQAKLNLAIPESDIKRIAARIKEIKAFANDRRTQEEVIGLLKNPPNKGTLINVVNVCLKEGIPIKLPPDIAAGERLWLHPDRKEYVHDIEIPQWRVALLMKSVGRFLMDQDEFAYIVEKDGERTIDERKYAKFQTENAKWEKYLKSPLSRWDMDNRVIPLAKSLQFDLGDGLHGGGKLHLNVNHLRAQKQTIKDRLGVSGDMVDHMYKTLGDMVSRDKAQETLARWLEGKWKPGERDHFEKTFPYWKVV
ncbi:hypothetical protein IAR55_001267 [Kwoniella newhampshirensis]|uniref:UBA domain-containing protein n=1 Tax=Kwoniella newhampshirensis TaxID=1651941 RepID=A0AAW0Z555_9TREE